MIVVAHPHVGEPVNQDQYPGPTPPKTIPNKMRGSIPFAKNSLPISGIGSDFEGPLVLASLLENKPHVAGKGMERTSRFLGTPASRLCSGDSDPEFFRKSLSDLFRQSVVNSSRTFFRGVEYGYGSWGSHRDSQPDQRRQRESGKRRDLQPKRMPRSEVPDDAKSQQKYSRRHRRESDQSYINNAMDLLPATAVFAGGKVFFVVAAHLWR